MNVRSPRPVAARTILGCVMLAALASCGPGAAVEVTSASPTASSDSPASPSASPSASTTPETTETPVPPPVPPPVQPGRARGAVVIVQRGEDASLVSGGDPVRLTVARTQNSAAWMASPPQAFAGTMTTEEALLSLGWRPSEDGTTGPLPAPRPNALLAWPGGELGFSVLRANVRADGTLVLDVRPLGAVPAEGLSSVDSFGPVSLTLDGVPGVLVEQAPLVGDLSAQVLVTGRRNDQAVVQVINAEGEVLASEFLAVDLGTAYPLDAVATDTTSLTGLRADFVPPTSRKPGSVTIIGEATIEGTASPVRVVIARWSLPQ